MKKRLIPVPLHDKWAIKKWANQGFTANEIRMCFSEFKRYTRQQIAAVMAHCTMGGRNYPK